MRRGDRSARNSLTWCGVGGSPVRSNVARRIRTCFSAGGANERSCSSCFSARNASTAVLSAASIAPPGRCVVPKRLKCPMGLPPGVCFTTDILKWEKQEQDGNDRDGVCAAEFVAGEVRGAHRPGIVPDALAAVRSRCNGVPRVHGGDPRALGVESPCPGPYFPGSGLCGLQS